MKMLKQSFLTTVFLGIKINIQYKFLDKLTNRAALKSGFFVLQFQLTIFVLHEIFTAIRWQNNTRVRRCSLEPISTGRT